MLKNRFKRWFFALSIAFCPFLQGDVEDYFKMPQGKTEGHSMRNIDYIYMINLDQRPEKYKKSIDQLLPYGIEPYRYSAVNGWELSLETINGIGLKFSPEMEPGIMGTSYHLNGNFEPSHEIIERYGQTYFCHCMARGTMGCALSHLSVLQDAYDSGYETIWVMEDDIDVLQNPHILSDLIDELDKTVGKDNWDVLFTDADIRDGNGFHKPCYWEARRPDYLQFALTNHYGLRVDIGTEFRKIGARYGSHSMIIRRCGIKKLLQFFKAHQIFMPYDLDYIFPRGIGLYCVVEDVVSNLARAPSDNGGPNYLKKESN